MADMMRFCRLRVSGLYTHILQAGDRSQPRALSMDLRGAITEKALMGSDPPLGSGLRV